MTRSASNRRKEERHSVKLKGELRSGGKSIALEVGDLSRSGALILMKGAPPVGTNAELWIEEYGPFAIEIVHAGLYFCGVTFKHGGETRNPLQRWLGDAAVPA